MLLQTLAATQSMSWKGFSRFDLAMTRKKGQQMLAFFSLTSKRSMRIHLLGRFNSISRIAICTIEEQVQKYCADRSQQNT